MAVLFISEDKLKKSTTINGNVDVELLLPYIKVSQDTRIHEILGTDLYNKLQADITASTLTGAYQTLVDDYIQDCLVHYALYEAMPFLSFKIMNKDIVRKTSETSTAASLEDIKYLRNIVLNTAEWYAKRLVEYLCNNTSSFSEYSTNSGADISPTKDAYFSGMNLGTPQTNWLTLNDFLTPDLT